MARRRRPSLAPDLPSRSRAARRLEAPLYSRDGASRLLFGTPAARRPYLLNDLVSAPRNAPLPKLVGMARRSAASFQLAQLSVAPARESDHGDANEFSQFSVSPAFSRASAGVRSRFTGIGGQKTNRKQARLRKVAFLKATFVQRMRPRAGVQF